MTITENKTSRIEEKLERITELLRILLRANFRGWDYKFITREGRSPVYLLHRKNSEDFHFAIDFEGLLLDAEKFSGSLHSAIRLASLEFALVRGRWCNLKAVQIEALAQYIERVLYRLAD